MKRLALLAFVLLFSSTTPSLSQPPEHFHTLDEYYSALFSLQEQHPDFMSIDSIGHSQADHEPIYLVKISDNVQVDEDEPTTLFVGHIHAEEILGIEVTLSLIEDLLEEPPRPAMRNRRNGLEMFFIPTMNPEGLRIVFGEGEDAVYGPDVTFRKNKRDTMGDGLFRYQVGWGNDTSGVDLNRNFDINWAHGDTLLHLLNETEPYDYYAGRAPFSEAENLAVRYACELVQPMYSVTFHSSRSGNYSEKVNYPWNWGLDLNKRAPDQDMLDAVAINFASLLPKLDGSGHYEPIASGGRNGKMHDWMYAAGGWVNMQTEIGNQVIQPDLATTEQIVADTKPALLYLLDRALGLPNLDGESGHLATYVTDEAGQPLIAEVILPDRHNGYLAPRMTEPVYGVQRRPLISRSYTVVTRAFGYTSDTTDVFVGSFGDTPHHVTLTRKPFEEVVFRAADGTTGSTVPATFVFHRDWDVDTLRAGGWARLEWPHGEYAVEFHAEGYLPKTLHFNPATQQEVVAFLSEVETQQLESFEEGLGGNWTLEGTMPWVISGWEAANGSRSLKSSGEYMVPASSEGTAMVQLPIPDGAAEVVIHGMRKYELEPDYDFCYVDMRYDSGDWFAVDTLNGYADWQPFFYSANEALEMGAESVNVRWRYQSDDTDIDRGVFLDDISLLAADNFYDVDENSGSQPIKWSLHPVSPNPFNPVTTVRFDVAKAGTVTLKVYDILGRHTKTLLHQDLRAGVHTQPLDMSNQAAGLYFLRMEAAGFQQVQKLVLLK